MKLLLKTMMVKGRRSKRCRSPAASLTDDLLIEILSRLPARSICRFKCVSTTWRDLISANNRKLPQTLAGIFTIHDPEYSMGSSPLATRLTNVLNRGCPWVSPWFDFLPANGVELYDCCNGLVLCGYWRTTTGGFQLFVCNPATKKWVELPDSNLGNKPRDCYLGFNPTMSPHFYVFEFFRDYDEDFSLLATGVEVYSSETGQWVHVEDNGISSHACHSNFHAIFLNNGRLHYLTNDLTVAVVDTQGKVCQSIHVPDNKDYYGFIQQSQGRLYYANFETDNKGRVIRFLVYVLEDYDNQQWTLKHITDAFYVFGQERYKLALGFEWVAIHPDRNMIFYNIGYDKTLMSYDMDRRQLQVISTLGHHTREVYWPYVPLFSELQSLHI